MALQTTPSRKSESGAVFFYILLAIALLAALTYAVSRGQRGGLSTLTDQQAKLAAQEIIEYGNTVANTVQKLKLRGFQDTEISFGNSVYVDQASAPYNAPGHNPNCTSSDCEIFSSEGGSLSPMTFADSSTKDNQSAGNVQFLTVDVDNIGSAERELVLKLYRLKPEICGKINRLLGISNSDYLPPVDSWGQLSYNGSYSAPVDPIGDVATLLSGKTAFCHSSGTGYYHFWQVLIAR